MSGSRTLKKLRADVKSGRVEGCTCPVCTLYVKEYERGITKCAVMTLWRVKEWYDLNDPSLKTLWMHVENEINSLPKDKRPSKSRGASGDFGKLRFFGLIEKMPNDDPKKKSSGRWRITQKGVDFLNGDVKVYEYIRMFKGKYIGSSPNMVDVQFCLGKHFSYADLMGW